MRLDVCSEVALVSKRLGALVARERLLSSVRNQMTLHGSNTHESFSTNAAHRQNL